MNEKEMLVKIEELSQVIIKLEERILKLETGESYTGVILDGVPEYAKNFINQENKEGVGLDG